MRQKAEKLEKGKWYADMSHKESGTTFLKYSHSDLESDFYKEQKGWECYKMYDGFFGFTSLKFHRFIPTKEDREKYNLVDDE